MRPKHLNKFLVAIVILSVLVVLGGYLVRLAFDESAYVRRGSIGYLLLIDRAVKEFPVYQPVEGSTLYWSGMGDGEKPSMTGVVFCTRSTEADVLSFYDEHFKRSGYAQEDWRNPFSATAVMYSSEKAYAKLSIAPGEEAGCVTRVVIDYWD